MMIILFLMSCCPCLCLVLYNMVCQRDSGERVRFTSLVSEFSLPIGQLRRAIYESIIPGDPVGSDQQRYLYFECMYSRDGIQVAERFLFLNLEFNRCLLGYCNFQQFFFWESFQQFICVAFIKYLVFDNFYIKNLFGNSIQLILKTLCLKYDR